jgi:hypothetical protein
VLETDQLAVSQATRMPPHVCIAGKKNIVEGGAKDLHYVIVKNLDLFCENLILMQPF